MIVWVVCLAWRGMACVAWRGMACVGSAWLAWRAWRGVAWLAWLGMAWRGEASSELELAIVASGSSNEPSSSSSELEQRAQQLAMVALGSSGGNDCAFATDATDAPTTFMSGRLNTEKFSDLLCPPCCVLCCVLRCVLLNLLRALVGKLGTRPESIRFRKMQLTDST